MFGILKKKLSKIIESVSGKVAEEKPTVEEKRAEPIQQEITHMEIEHKEPVPEPGPIIEEPKIEDVEPEKEGIPDQVEELKPEMETVQEQILTIIEEKKQEEKEVTKKKSWVKKITEKVVKSVAEKKLSYKDIEPLLDEIMSDMIEADVAVEVAEKIKSDMIRNLEQKEVRRGKEKEFVIESLRSSLLDILNVGKIDMTVLPKTKKPYIILFLGFNGAGKTTSLAKVAAWLKTKNLTSIMAAADTFRAAAEEQLEVHGERIGVNVIKHRHGADPAAVIFDAIEHAKSRGLDFVLADTAGRAHTNENLINQLKKVCKVNKPDMKVLVLDSLTGNDILQQSKFFDDAVGVDAIIFTKMDVNEKGGNILTAAHTIKKPILFLGMGESYKDFEEYDHEKLVNLLL